MKLKNLFYVILVSVLAACGSSNDGSSASGGKKAGPFSGGSLLESAQGEWFSSTCVPGDGVSSIEMMKFDFNQPLSWENDFFAQDSLEFSGRLELMEVNYDNEYCLGKGEKTYFVSSSETRNLSVIRNSVKSDQFMAFYAMEIDKGFAGEVDTGSGYLFEFKRVNNTLEVSPRNNFTFSGKTHKLSALDSLSKTQFNYVTKQKPLKSQNTAFIVNSLVSLVNNRRDCSSSFQVYEKEYGSNYYKLVVIASRDNKMTMFSSFKSKYGTSRFESNNVDWIYSGGSLYTEKGFEVRESLDSFILVHEDRSIRDYMQEKTWLEVQNILKKYNFDAFKTSLDGCYQ